MSMTVPAIRMDVEYVNRSILFFVVLITMRMSSATMKRRIDCAPLKMRIAVA